MEYIMLKCGRHVIVGCYNDIVINLRCGRHVIVGCYDGSVYVLNIASGAIVWSFQTGDAVKSSPLVDPEDGCVYVGSHDGRCDWHKCAMNWH